MAISEQTKQAVLIRDNCRCRSCGFSDSLTMEIDHVKPRSLGGSDDLDSLQALCSFCNNTKGNVEIEALAIQAPLALSEGFGDRHDVTCNRIEFKQLVADVRGWQIEELANQARTWKQAGTRGLTIRKRLDKLTTSGIVEEILSTIR